MNKQQLTEWIVSKHVPGFETKVAAERAIEAVLGGITEGLKKDSSVQLTGFGSFSVKTRAGRTGRNPQTGQTIYIPSTKTVGFKAGKGLREGVC